MLSKKMMTTLNSQISAELYSGYLYMAMSAWLQSEAYLGASRWMAIQAREEVFHASKIYDYIIGCGGQVKLGAIEAPPIKWKAPLEVFEVAYAHEKKISALINNLMTLAKSENDHATEIFLQWFVSEQVEEEASVQEVVQKFKLAGGQGSGMFMIDRELGTRSLSPLVADAITGTITGAATTNSAG